jgi:DNA end-binding protein Ku
MRAMWKGTVAFGLVAIPINLYAATENKGVTLRQVHESDGGRIQYKRYCSVEDAEVPYAEIAKGYELDDGRMVVLTDAELSSLPLPTQKTIDVLEFVPLAAIDPLFFDKAYYLEPQKSAVKPYVLLRDALHKSGHVAIAKVALRQREVLAVLRVHADVLTMSTMLWPDEVRTPDFSFLQQDAPQVREQELTMAGQLIDSLAEPVFEPDRYQDSYRQALENLIDAKIEGDEVATPPGVEATAEVVDLISALQASVKAASKGAGGGSGAASASKARGGAGRKVAEKAVEKKAPAKRRSTRSA